MNTAHSSAAAATPVTNSSSPEPLPCPRCNSRDTKFCYYNNYNLTQPRHYCRACRRYWTQGGTLRNVPVGGGCRKNKQGVPTDSAKYIPQQMSTEAPFTVWSPNANSNFSVPVPDAQIRGMGYNGFQLIQSEVVPAHPFQVDVSGLGIQEMNQYAGGYTGNVHAFGDEYEIFDSNNVIFGSVSDGFPVNGSDIGYWNPGSAWDGAFP